MPESYFVITTIGPDRRGLAAQITDAVLAHKANILESRMSRLGGEFAVLMLIAVQGDIQSGLVKDLEKIGDADVHIFIKQTDLSRIGVFEGFVPYTISVLGADHEGIVYAVAAYLAKNQIQVEEMNTQVNPAPVTGTPLFSMWAEVQVPPGVKLAALRENLQHLGDDLGVDIDIQLIGG